MEDVLGPDGIAMRVAVLELVFSLTHYRGPQRFFLVIITHRAVANYGIAHCTPNSQPHPKPCWP